MEPVEWAATAATAGAVLWTASKIGEKVTDTFGQNRPDCMRNTGIFETTQKVGEFCAMAGTAIGGLCSLGQNQGIK